ncbi:MAG: hypothetical protein MJ130_06195 [Lachnospiraceae bacterium]|nr:hypothetical protein [Lachnospiraceae bacterium]
MEKINYIFYSWSEYIRSNRIIGIYLIVLALSTIIVALLAEKNELHTYDNLKKTINLELYFKNSVYLLLTGIIISTFMLIPFTVLVLMQFQTVFYSYNSLWSMAIILPIIAFALTLLIIYLYNRLSKKGFVIVTVLISILLILCGNMFKSTEQLTTFDSQHDQVSYEDSRPLLDRLEQYAVSQNYSDGITILAPKNITTYVHMYPGNIKTLYGKDIWDSSMAPYTYNVYSDDCYNLYTWINCTEAYGSFYHIDDQTPVQSYYLSLSSTNEFDTVEDLESAALCNKLEGGTPYISLARQCNVDIIVLYSDGKRLDNDALDLITQKENIEQEYIAINETEGYILLIL